MIDIKFVPHTDDNIKFIADTMRYEDHVEIIASGYKTPHEALKRSVAISEYVSVAEYEGTPLVIFGMGRPNMLSGKVVIWMLGSTEASKYKREFIIYTRNIFKEMFQHADVLYNYVHVYNKPSIRWLKCLGATFSEPVKMGLYGEKFMKFEVKNV